MTAYLVTYEQIISLKSLKVSNKIINVHKAFVVANSSEEAISLLENFLDNDVKNSNGVISHNNFVATLCSPGDMLLDCGTYISGEEVL